MVCINFEEVIEKVRKELCKTKVYCEKCKKDVKFRIEYGEDFYYECVECKGDKDSDLQITNDIFL